MLGCEGGIPATVFGRDRDIHPGILTWNLQITHLERNMIFQTSIIMFHVNLQGCMMYLCVFFDFSTVGNISDTHKPLFRYKHLHPGGREFFTPRVLPQAWIKLSTLGFTKDPWEPPGLLGCPRKLVNGRFYMGYNLLINGVFLGVIAHWS